MTRLKKFSVWFGQFGLVLFETTFIWSFCENFIIIQLALAVLEKIYSWFGLRWHCSDIIWWWPGGLVTRHTHTFNMRRKSQLFMSFPRFLLFVSAIWHWQTLGARTGYVNLYVLFIISVKLFLIFRFLTLNKMVFKSQ